MANKKKTTDLALRVWCIIIALVVLAGVALMVLQFCTPAGKGLKPSEWFSKQEQPNKPDGKDPDKGNSGNLIVGDIVQTEGAKMLSAVIPKESFADYGISAQAENAVSLTITDIQPDYAQDQSFSWELKFLYEIDDDYATNYPDEYWSWSDSPTLVTSKAVADYMNITVAEDTHSAVVACTQAFGHPIFAVATSNSNPDVKLQCRFDYLQRINSMTAKAAAGMALPGETIRVGASWNYTIVTERNSSAFTIGAEIEMGEMKIGFSDEMKSGTSFASYAQDITITPTEGSYQIPSPSYEWFCGFFNDNSPSHIKAVMNRVAEMNGASNQHCLVVKQDYTVKYNGEAVDSGTAVGYLNLEFEDVPVSDANLNKEQHTF